MRHPVVKIKREDTNVLIKQIVDMVSKELDHVEQKSDSAAFALNEKTISLEETSFEDLIATGLPPRGNTLWALNRRRILVAFGALALVLLGVAVYLLL